MTKNQPDRPASKAGNKSRDLRRQAETLMAEQRPTGREPADLKSTLHELQIHQLELELQNQELQRAHLEAELARRKYFDLYDLAPVGYATLNPRGEILEVNLAGARLLGQDRGRLINRRFQLFVAPDDIPGFNHFLEKVFSGGSREPCELTLLPEGRPPMALRLEGSRAEPDEGQGARCRAALLDTTEQKQAEADRLELVRQRLAAQKLESLIVLAGGMAHDFNNLLGVIMGNLELVSLELAPALPVQTNLEEAGQAARQAADLIRQMMAYTGYGGFRVTDVDLNALVKDQERIFKSWVNPNIRFRLKGGADASRFRADPDQVKQIIRNLLVNASEAVGGREGAVTLSTGLKIGDAAYLNSSWLEEKPAPGRFVYLEVSDDGPGMSPETAARMFEPFFSTKFTGRGLGLAAVQGIVRAGRGAILVDSRPGAGTTVRVLFPVSENIIEKGEGDQQ